MMKTKNASLKVQLHLSRRFQSTSVFWNDDLWLWAEPIRSPVCLQFSRQVRSYFNSCPCICNLFNLFLMIHKRVTSSDKDIISSEHQTKI